MIAGGRGVCGEGKLREYERARIAGLARVTAGPLGFPVVLMTDWGSRTVICLICLT